MSKTYGYIRLSQWNFKYKTFIDGGFYGKNIITESKEAYLVQGLELPLGLKIVVHRTHEFPENDKNVWICSEFETGMTIEHGNFLISNRDEIINIVVSRSDGYTDEYIKKYLSDCEVINTWR